MAAGLATGRSRLAVELQRWKEGVTHCSLARLALVAMATLPELHWRVVGSEWERHRVSRREWRG